MSYSQTLPNDNGQYAWYQCNCCPYGYHIDLDFIRHCETVGQQVERTGSIKRRRDRRRQRQSMEVLLGLASPINNSSSNKEPLPPIRDITRSPLIEDALNDVVSDFERTLQRFKNKLSNNLPDVTAVSGDGSGGRDFDTISIESCGLSPAALQNIREQMALSLERTKELEEMVKMLPVLEAQLSTLKEENKRLVLQLQAEEEQKLNMLNSNYIVNQFNSRNRSNSFSNIDGFDNNSKHQHQHQHQHQPSFPLPRRDFGVMAGVLTRTVGVGNHTPSTKTVSTTTYLDNRQYVDRWYTEKSKFLNGHDAVLPPITAPSEKIVLSQGVQVKLMNEIRDKSAQTTNESRDASIQTKEKKRVLVDAMVNATVPTLNSFTQHIIETNCVGVSDHKIEDDYCAKCNAPKSHASSSTRDIFNDNNQSSKGTDQSISLAALSLPRSKSFNLEEKLNLKKSHRTIGCQYEILNMSHKASQSEVKTVSKLTQYDIPQTNKGIQYEITNIVNRSTDTMDLQPIIQPPKKPIVHSKSTDTSGLTPIMKHKSIEKRTTTCDVGCNTITLQLQKESLCTKCSSNKDGDEFVKKDEATTPSRIPRLQISMTTSVENRKFKRQDTYTKMQPQSPAGAADKSPQSLSALELSPSKNLTADASTTFEKVKEKYNLTEESIKTTPNNGHSSSILTQNTPTATATVPENVLCQLSSPRKKCVPSKEMQAAIKVLNDSIQKNNGRDIRSQLKNANAIVESEWFKISSTVYANPLDVEDYLDTFEDISSALLEYVVNMVDASGNTAMHYAVSHGNFDVVSILLDSKVCNINKQNKAGYTSVMLVSLAEVRSQTHANVVRRLFSLADVNIRAKQHGQTALMLAVSHGRIDMVQMLLEAGADINIQDEDGSTALMCAAEHGHVDIVKYFLSQRDCDSSICDVDGSTALKIAMEAGHRHIGVLLYAHERNLHANVATRQKKSKSTSASPKTPSSPLMQRHVNRALPTSNK